MILAKDRRGGKEKIGKRNKGSTVENNAQNP